MTDPSSMAVVAFVTSWFTPISLFLFLNLMIGTLFFTAHFTISSKNKEDPRDDRRDNHRDDHRYSDSAQLQTNQAPSLLKRVNSFNFSQYRNFDHQQYTHQQYTEVDHAPPLVRAASSVLQRIKSVNLTQFRFDRSASETDSMARVTTGNATALPLLQRLKSINLWDDSQNPEPQSDPVEERETPPLARVPSFLARVKSINFSLYGQDNEYAPEETTEQVHVEEHRHVQRFNSDTIPSGGEAPAKLPRKMRKSASHKSAFGHFGQEKTVDNLVELEKRPESVREGRRKRGFAGEEGEEEQIDSKADDFIYKFRQQLKLQRMDSIVRYKEIITRSHAAD